MDITTILRQRDRQSFDWLYKRYAHMLFGTIRRIVLENSIAERVLQETFVEAWKSLDEYEGKAGDFFIWMLRIARAKANGYVSSGDREDQQAGKNEMRSVTTSFQHSNSGQKQYSNY